METFSALLAICAGNSPVPGEFPAQRPVTRSFDVYFDLSPNKRLSKQLWGWWFETQSRPLWRHRNECDERVHNSCGALATTTFCHGAFRNTKYDRCSIVNVVVLITEAELSFWRNFRHWSHQTEVVILTISDVASGENFKNDISVSVYTTPCHTGPWHKRESTSTRYRKLCSSHIFCNQYIYAYYKGKIMHLCRHVGLYFGSCNFTVQLSSYVILQIPTNS